ncbi:Nuclear pore complex protein like [Heracleum sosnowskyi]|uniref:Nuclear pore complex protein like n=1 Tax=Heracleum sosnowskyi TaxID=360622 RepID=A0AAD8J4F1_9APIA|nr:Nuclear pore complex protein like [Heracleum sosnowskyi]
MLHSHHFLSSLHPPSPISHPHIHIHIPPLSFTSPPLRRPISIFTRPGLKCLAQPNEDVGPVELPPQSNSIFATDDDPTTLQVATSLLLTGAISVFLFRSLRRRAKRAKELKFRSDGVKKSIKEEALESLKAMTPAASLEADANKPPSVAQTLLGGISAGVIALILYKFTTTVEASLNRQTLSDNFSVRQITVTIRTIINGICYLATFVFGINSVGLFLYSGQLALNSLMGESTSEETTKKGEGSSNLTESDSSELNKSSGDNNVDSTQ